MPAHTPTNTQNLATILKRPGVRKKPYLVRGRDEVVVAARNITSDSLAPIFLTSAVTGGWVAWRAWACARGGSGCAGSTRSCVAGAP
jgi:hypothetical protein